MLPDTSWNALLRPWISNRYFDLSDLRLFDPGAPDFSLTNAWWLCELSRLIYRQDPDEAGSDAPPPTRSEILHGVGLKEMQAFCHGTNYCALVTTDTKASDPFAVLVFRGTRGFKSWPSNLNSRQTLWPGGGFVHGGFNTGFNGLWQKIEPILSSIDLPLFFTGHSMGGALALLAASLRPDAVVYKFGAPKTGDAAFACSLESTRIYRVENKHDLIPTLPPAAVSFGFRHVGISICLKDDLLSGLRSRSTRGWLDPPEFLSDHAPVNYTIRLENMMTRNLRSPTSEPLAGDKAGCERIAFRCV
ncbi:MAG: lipase family protein [Pseudomonadota bacterium]